jgi:hypothetical protein
MVPDDSGFPTESRPAHVQGIPKKAAEGIRTLDLLHGNYTGHQQMTAITHASFAGLS